MSAGASVYMCGESIEGQESEWGDEKLAGWGVAM